MRRCESRSRTIGCCIAGSENGREDIADGRLTELLAIHFRSGLTVLTTCSPRSSDLVRSRGADHIFDYSDRDSVSKIKQLTNNDLAYIFDCVGQGSAPNFCYEAMGRKGGNMSRSARLSLLREPTSKLGKSPARHAMQDLVQMWLLEASNSLYETDSLIAARAGQ